MNPSARAQEIEDLLGDTTWLQEMARSMVGDPFTAEDLVQESLLQAKADGPWTTGKLGGWIAGVLRNKVLLHWRSERRRIAREQKAAFMHAAELELAEAEDRHPDPAVLTQRVEDQQILAETLLQLDDASREVLLLTYYGSRNVPQVAKQLGISEDAAESRVRRARARLRTALEQRCGKGHWAMMLAPWLPRTTPMPAPGPVLPFPPSWAAAAVPLLVGLVAFGPWGEDAPQPEIDGGRGGQEASLEEASGPGASSLERREVDPLPAAPAAGEVVFLRFLDAATGQPMVDLAPRLIPARRPTAAEAQRLDDPARVVVREQSLWSLSRPELVTDGEGRVALPLPPEASLVIFDLDLHTPTHSVRDYGRSRLTYSRQDLLDGEVTVEMVPRNGRVDGLVRDTDGLPVAGATVELYMSSLFHPSAEPLTSVRADGRGQYLLERVFSNEGGFEVIPRHPGHVPVLTGTMLQGVEMKDPHISFPLELAPATERAVQVTDAQGQAVAAATLRSLPAAALDGAVARPWMETITAADGRGALLLPTSLPATVEVHAPGYLPWRQLVSADLGTLRIQLEAGVRMQAVVSLDGRPLAGAALQLLDPDLMEEGESSPRVVTGADGSALLPPWRQGADFRLLASHPEAEVHLSPTAQAVADGQAVAVDLHPGLALGGRVEGVVGPDDQVLAPTVYLRPAAARPWLKGGSPPAAQEAWMAHELAAADLQRVDADGHFRFTGLPPGRYLVWFGNPQVMGGVLEAQAGQEDLVLTPLAGAGTRPVLRGQVTDAADGSPVQGPVLVPIQRDADGRQLQWLRGKVQPPMRVVHRKDAQVELMLPEPGHYTLGVWAPRGYVGVELPLARYEAGPADLDLDLPRAKREALRVVGADGRPLAGASIAVYLEEKGRRAFVVDPRSRTMTRAWSSDAAGSLMLPSVPAEGDYLLEVRTTDGSRVQAWRQQLVVDAAGVVQLTVAP